MITAYILICAAASSPNPDRCTLMQDTRGPYAEKAKCEARVKEMHRSLYSNPTIIAGLLVKFGPGYRAHGQCVADHEQA